MIKSLALLFLVFLNSAGIAQTRTALKDAKLKGKVKSIYVKQTHRYKKAGVFTPWENSYRDSTLFNNTGFRTAYTEFTGKDSVNYKVVYTYALKNKTGNISYFNKHLQPTTKSTLTYDDRSNLVKETRFNIDGSPDYTYLQKFDSRDNVIERMSMKNDGVMTSRYTYTYDDKNNLLSYVLETPGYQSATQKYRYDDKGNKIEETWFDGYDKVTFLFKRMFDSYGHVIEESKYKGGDKFIGTTTYSYTYDRNGNWLKRVESTKEGEEYHIDERAITYY